MNDFSWLVWALVAALTLSIGCGDDGSTTTDTGTPMDSAADGTGECAGAADGTACAGGNICVDGACVASSCGDGYVDGDAGELCDDGNDIPGDGCEPDTCTPSCSEDADCDDEDPCNGAEMCNSSGRCQIAAMDPCDDGDPCTADTCDPEMGCGNELIDVDGDGYSPETCTTAGLMGGDCDDTNFSIYPGADELCDSLDNDCNSVVDDGTVDITCYADDDGDTYGDDGDTVVACTCPSGYVSRGGDCDDTNPDVSPDHTDYETTGYCVGGGSACRDPSFDWNCDGDEEQEITVVSPGCSTDCSVFCRCTGSGWVSSVPACGQPTGLFAANYRTCSGVLTCSDSTSRRTQGCR